MGELREKTISGVKWSAIGRFSTQGISFIIGLLLARVLSPSDYGVIGMVGIFFAIAQTFIDSGFGAALIRKKDCSEADYNTAFYFNILVGLISCIILSLTAPFIARFFNIPILEDLVIVMSINMLINSFTIVQWVKLNSAIDFKSQAKISLITTVLSGCIGLTLAYAGFGVWSLVFQKLAATIFRTFLLFLTTRWFPKWLFSKQSLSYLFDFGGKILITSLLNTIYCNMTTMLIGKFYSSKDLGYYSRGESIANFPSMNLTSILQSVTYPVLSKIQDDDKRLIQVYRKYISITSMVIFFGMLLLAALAKPLIVTLLTDKWLDSAIYLQIFCFVLMFDHICQLNLNILYVKGRSDLVLRLEVIKKTISISMIVAAIPFGVLAICISRAIYTQIAIIINTYYTGKLFGLGYFEQIKDFSRFLLCSFYAVLPAFILTFIEMNPIIVLILGSGIAIFIYYLMLRKFPIFLELISLVKSQF